MGKRKTLLWMITCIFLLFSTMAIYGGNAITKEEAQEIAMSFLKNDIQLKDLDTKLKFKKVVEDKFKFKLDQKENLLIWDVIYEYEEKSIIVGVDKAGKIVTYSKDNGKRGDEKELKTKITKEEAQKIGEDFIKKIKPEEYKEVNFYDSSDYNTEYGLKYIRKVNNIDFDDNFMWMIIDKENGEILHYDMVWDYNVNFEDAKDVITEEAAKELFIKNAKLNLYYAPGEKEETNLVYELEKKVIDGKKGIVIESKDKNKNSKEISEEEKEKILGNSAKVDTKEVSISKEEARKAMEETLKGLLNDTVRLNDNLRLYEEKNKKRNGNWGATYEKDYEYLGHILIDDKNKEIIYFTKTNYNKGPVKNITWEQGYDIALDKIKKGYPNKIMNIDTNLEAEENASGSDYTYNFVRTENGLKYKPDGIRINVNKEAGEVSLIGCDWSNLNSLPNKSKAMAEEEAKKILLENHKIKLCYEKQEDGSIKLVYILEPIKKDYSLIDATNGEVIKCLYF